MLRKSDILSIRPLAESIRFNDKGLTAIPGTPLAELNAACRISLLPEETVTSLLDAEDTLTGPETALVERSASMDVSKEERHSVLLGQYARFISNRVSGTLNYARNTINPLVADIIVACDEAVRDAIASKHNDPTIVMLDINEVYLNAGLETLIATYRTRVAADAPLSTPLANQLTQDMTSEEFIAAVRTGIPEVDDAVQEIITKADGENTVGDLSFTLCEMFNFVGHEDQVFTNHHPLIAYLFLLGVRNGRSPSNDYNALTADQRLAVVNALRYFGFIINTQINMATRFTANNRLVLATSGTITHNSGKVMVNGPVYRRWLEAGGSPEAVLGWLRARGTQSLSDSGDLYEAPVGYQERYVRQQRTALAEGRNRANSAINRTIRVKLLEYIRAEYADEPETRLAMITKANEFMDAALYVDSISLDGFVLRAVCCVLGKDNSDAYVVLTTMRDLMKQDPEMTPQVAAFCAAAQLIAGWVTAQVAEIAD